MASIGSVTCCPTQLLLLLLLFRYQIVKDRKMHCRHLLCAALDCWDRTIVLVVLHFQNVSAMSWALSEKDPGPPVYFDWYYYYFVLNILVLHKKWCCLCNPWITAQQTNASKQYQLLCTEVQHYYLREKLLRVYYYYYYSFVSPGIWFTGVLLAVQRSCLWEREIKMNN